MPSYRYRTTIFIGAWHRTRREALREAVADDAATWRSKARDEVDWHGEGEIEEAPDDRWKGGAERSLADRRISAARPPRGSRRGGDR